MNYEERIVATWEEVYKKGQLTFWILLGLKKDPASMAELKDWIEHWTQQTVTADDQSMYRALRRLKQMELIDYQTQPSTQGGPEIKIYALTSTGQTVLRKFIQRNITPIYYNPTLKQLMLN